MTTVITTTKIRTAIAILGAALTVGATTGTFVPNADAQLNRGCDRSCQLAVEKNRSLTELCDPGEECGISTGGGLQTPPPTFNPWPLPPPPNPTPTPVTGMTTSIATSPATIM
jgi:hypothetical protein